MKLKVGDKVTLRRIKNGELIETTLVDGSTTKFVKTAVKIDDIYREFRPEDGTKYDQQSPCVIVAVNGCTVIRPGVKVLKQNLGEEPEWLTGTEPSENMQGAGWTIGARGHVNAHGECFTHDDKIINVDISELEEPGAVMDAPHRPPEVEKRRIKIGDLIDIQCQGTVHQNVAVYASDHDDLDVRKNWPLRIKFDGSRTRSLNADGKFYVGDTSFKGFSDAPKLDGMEATDAIVDDVIPSDSAPAKPSVKERAAAYVRPTVRVGSILRVKFMPSKEVHELEIVRDDGTNSFQFVTEDVTNTPIADESNFTYVDEDGYWISHDEVDDRKNSGEPWMIVQQIDGVPVMLGERP